MYGTEEIVERLVEVWRGEGFPVGWRQGVICPLYKKGEKNKVENYCGITLLNTRKDEERDRGKGSGT
jgi:hypothetical protein